MDRIVRHQEYDYTGAVTWVYPEEELRATLVEHHEMVDCLRRHDGERLRALVRQHLETTERVVLEMLETAQERGGEMALVGGMRHPLDPSQSLKGG